MCILSRSSTNISNSQEINEHFVELTDLNRTAKIHVEDLAMQLSLGKLLLVIASCARSSSILATCTKVS